jgi:type II secretory pathway pseudopilin PulG
VRRRLVKIFSGRIGSPGVSLFEILVGLAIFGVIGIALIDGVTTSYKAIDISQERVAAESLAKSQIEYIKVQDYIMVVDYDPGNPAARYETVTIPPDLASANYSIEISAPAEIISANESAFELQGLNITVKRSGQSKLMISFYRVSGT